MARRFGGVRQAKPPVSRVFGGVRAPKDRGAHPAVVSQCQCGGRVVPYDGRWVHSDTCPHRMVMYRNHGWRLRHWYCVHGCPGVELADVITHHHACVFWDEHRATPF
jgi:hypothetical protein